MPDRAASRIQSYCVQYDSMEPTISMRTDLLADRAHYTRRQPQRWDVVVFTLPAETKETGAEADRFVKRVIGLPGETIQLTAEGLIVNGARVEAPPLLADRFSSFRSFDGHRFGAEPYEIPSDSVFLIGDNPRIYVSDSREFGPIPIQNIESRVLASVRTDPIT